MESGMTLSEILTLLISIFALFLSSVAIWRTEKTSRKLNETTIVRSQIEIRTLIENTRKDKDTAEMDAKMLGAGAKDSDEFANAALQDLEKANKRHLNAYREACIMYLEHKIDRASFRRSYEAEIKNLVESSVTSEYIMKNETDYQDIRKVYAEWEGKI